MKPANNKQYIPLLGFLLLAALFLIIIIINKNAIKEMDENAQLCTQMSKYAAPSEKYRFLQFCNLYFNNPCTKDTQCGPFICINSKCLVKPCTTDNDCPSRICSNQKIKNFCSNQK